MAMNAVSDRRPTRGFSLIEVLVAVVILAFSLLALAALQTRLIQASADAKAQSVALSLAKERLEEMRGFECITGCGTNYLELDSGSDTLNDDHDSDPATPGLYGGTNYTRRWTVKRYVLPTAALNFCPAGSASCTAVTNTSVLPAVGFAPNTEFKTVEVQLGWTDATGQPRVVRMEDAIAALDPQDSARNRRNRGGLSRGPEVIIQDPSTETGVIPIAVGDGSETAATNPKPVNVSRSGDAVIETRFDVLTYSALSGDNAIAQSRVETTVLGCSCSNTATSDQGYRPTYWNGRRYVAPLRNTTAATARASNGVVQSRYCDACCRDHHDAGFTGPQYSPRRGAPSLHKHYRIVGGELVEAGAGESYLEACRVIRVDGVFSVAADMYNDYFNLLATANASSLPAPHAVATLNYQNFVLKYLNNRFVAPTSGYNGSPTPLSPAPVALEFNLADPTPGDTSQPQPEPIKIDPTADFKWLHGRGLYVDYLEQAAIDAVGDAKANCKNPDGTLKTDPAERRDCVLKVLPFTSINLTEIADWKPLSGAVIKVSNDDFSLSGTLTTPVRGKVTPGTNPDSGNAARNAEARVTPSNSGVAIFGDITPEELAFAPTTANYLQPFLVATRSQGQAGGTFNVLFQNYVITPNDPLQAGFTYASRDDICNPGSAANPLPCATEQGETLPYGMTVRVGKYNKSHQDLIQNPCHSNGTTYMDYRSVHDVAFSSSNASATFGAPVVTNKYATGTIPGGEYTSVWVSTIAQGDTIKATFTSPAYRCPLNYPGSGNDFVCTGNGTNAIPTWNWGTDNRGTACPNQLAPPNFAPQ
jgi:type IV pilus modification protein PilV